MSKKGISKSDKIKLKFEAIWKAREIEMESFSARALYIWGFLTLCYGAYAFLLYQAISIFLFRKPCELSHPTGIFNTFNGLLMVVAIGIFVISILWVYMIKGANAWAERTDWMAECFIHNYLRTNPVVGSCCALTLGAGFSEIQKHKNCKICRGDPCHSCLLGIVPCSSEKDYFPKWDKSLISPNGGVYSPNKVYLFIAHISMWLGVVVAIVHAVVMTFVSFARLISGARYLSRNSWIVGIVLMGIIIFIIIFIIIRIVVRKLKAWLASHLGSETLQDDMAAFRDIRGE